MDTCPSQKIQDPFMFYLWTGGCFSRRRTQRANASRPRVIKTKRRGLFEFIQSPHKRHHRARLHQLSRHQRFQRKSTDRCTADAHYASETKDERQRILQNRDEAGGRILIKTVPDEPPSGVCQINGAPLCERSALIRNSNSRLLVPSSKTEAD